MVDLAGDISALVFKSSIKGELGQFSLDSQMLKVLMALDGKKNLAAVAREIGMNIATLKEALARLQSVGLIETVEHAVPMLNQDFFDFLKEHLSLALGPLAEFLIEDEIQELGDKQGKVPFSRAAELVNLLARQVPRQEKRVAFQQAMVQKIKAIKP